MQVKNNQSIGLSLSKEWLWGIAKFLVAGFSLLALLWQFQSREISIEVAGLPKNLLPTLIFLFFLMILNWYLEVLRWKVSIKSFEKITTRDSWCDVLSGLAMNWLLPFTIGDFLARIRTKRDKYKTSAAILLNRGIMLLLSTILGIFGLMSFHVNYLKIDVFPFFLTGLLLIGLLCFRNRLRKYQRYFDDLKRHLLIKIISISIFRYCVFVIQFLMLLKVFIPEISNWILIAGIGWIFFFRSIVPSFFGGIGLREGAAYVFFYSIVPDIMSVIIPVFLLWLLNTALPSVLGSVFILRLQNVR